MHPMLNIAVRAARSAGNLIVRYLDRADQLAVTAKDRNDFVTEVDRLAEQEIIRILRKAYPDHGILAEESGAQGSDQFQWVIDPLDGTTNFLHSFPHFAVSIALRRSGRIDQAVVYDPLRQELFTASRGRGAQLNERRIRVAVRPGLQGALLGTGFPFKAQQHLDAYLGMFRDLFRNTAGIRRAGSAALDLAYVAAGRLDGFWEIGLREWDIAAGMPIIYLHRQRCCGKPETLHRDRERDTTASDAGPAVTPPDRRVRQSHERMRGGMVTPDRLTNCSCSIGAHPSRRGAGPSQCPSAAPVSQVLCSQTDSSFVRDTICHDHPGPAENHTARNVQRIIN
jgi:myo-inositol-1(or 4)-monophosphatase